MTWQLKEKLQKTLAEEQGAMVFPPGSRQGFALVYPNTYHVGMSNLGFQIIYQQVNSRGDTACERLFLPDRKTEPEYIRTNTPLMTIETQRPLYGFSLIGFALTFEMDYFNVVNILQLGKVPVLAADRGEKDPLVIAGGPCATFNPEPLADLFDVFIIGEGEEIIHEILDVYYQARDNNISRQELLFKIAQIPGAYVPCFYQVEYKEDGTIKKVSCPEGVPQHVQRRWIQELDQYEAQTVIVTPNTEFKDMFLIEVARGCGRHCRFCMAGYCYRNPRVRSLKTLEAAVVKAKEYRNKVGLMGAAISDYPEIDSLCNIILEQGMHMSVASLRADTLTLDLVNALAVRMERFILNYGTSGQWYGTFTHFSALAIKHGISSRFGGISKPPFHSLNVALHTGDCDESVIINRQLFCQGIGINSEHIVTAQQLHTDHIAVVTKEAKGRGAGSYEDAIPNTDALITNVPGVPLMLFFADCVPVLIADPVQRAIGAVHAGWRGTVEKIAQKTILSMQSNFGTKPEDCLVGIAPSIGPCCYVVDEIVINKLKKQFNNWEELIKEANEKGKWYFDLWKANIHQLEEIGAKGSNLVTSGVCTACNHELFFSYRKENGATGRIGAVIVL
ncbi:MAG: hypothetical protein H6Q69_3800 [Firmicutes bacterium]|nr:hypothetical protein [Bacillota bacterium]